MYNFLTYSMMFLHMFVGLILIGIILLQRGRGGGLAGAFGGMGGQSAFGNRAGDLFTRITVVLATVWIVLGCVCVLLASNSRTRSSKIQEFAAEVKEAPADKADAGEKAAGDAKGEDLPIPAPAKPPGAADEKPVTPGEAADPKKSEPTDKVEEGKKDVKPEEASAKPDAAEEGAKKDVAPDSKEPVVEKPAEPAKKAEEGAAAEKAVPEEKKPE